MKQIFLFEMLFCGFIWYGASAIANTTSRRVLTITPLPILITLTQFMSAVLFGFLILKVLKIKQHQPVGKEGKQVLNYLSIVYTTGFLFVNAGYVMVNVSLAETLRSTEPLVTVILALIFVKTESITTVELISMFPIVIGGALSSYGDSSFSLIGLFFVCISNMSFSLRSMFTKHLRQVYNGDAFNVFYHISVLGTGYLIGLIFFAELYCIFFDAESHFSIAYNFDKLFVVEMLQFLMINGLTYVIYNQTSFYVLSRVSMVTHGVANAFRRVVTILCSVWYFGNHINNVNAFGIALAIFGVILYSKAKSEKSLKKSKISEYIDIDPEVKNYVSVNSPESA